VVRGPLPLGKCLDHRKRRNPGPESTRIAAGRSTDPTSSQKATNVTFENDTDTDPAAHWSFETKQVHAGQRPDPTTNARALPIYQTTSYAFDDTAHAAALFGLEVPGNIYTRIGNPTTDVVEQRIATLEGGVAALFLASGQAAETFAILNLAGAGDHIVSSPRLYGGTYNLFHYSLPKLGVDVGFVEDPDDLDAWRAAARPNTKAFFGETISNPQIDILDTPGVAGVAHEQGVPLIVDNTIATPYLIQPIAQGADIVVHSATKYLGGHGTAIAGVIVDGGTFDWAQDRFPGFTTPDPSYHGLVYAELGPAAFATKARVQLLRDYGASASPFNAFLVAQGLETLSLRIERHVANAQRVAEFLVGHHDVLSVNYAGLPSSPWHERAKRLAPKGTGAVLAFELAGGVDAGKAFVNALKLHSHVANIGDVRSLVIHPASTTHAQLSPAEQLASGVSPGLVRLAVGIEGIDDILSDLELGFAAARARQYSADSGDPHAVAAY
jgi:O-acetylhomoserine (thiol)-lyase